MAAETAPAAADSKETKKKGGKKKLVIIVVVLALGGGAYATLGMKKKPVPKTGDPMTAPATAKTLAQIAKLEDITLNLSDGHFLKLGLALQLAPKAPVADYTTGGAASKALDLAIDVFGSSSYSQLVKATQREQAKDQLSKAVVKAYNGQVEGLYITDFVMQ
jgi:flagellar protein FliL